MCENAVYPDMVVLHLKVHILQVKVHISNIFCLFVAITQEKADEGTVGAGGRAGNKDIFHWKYLKNGQKKSN